MFLRSFYTGIFVLLVVVAGAGCKKAATPADQQPVGTTNQIAGVGTDQNSRIQNQTSSSPLLRIHWLGKKRLATETNAANFMTIWNLPESDRLEAQTLDKLALWLAGNHPALSNYEDITNYSALVATNTPASTLRPLVQDLLQEEWLLEIQQPTNQPAEVALAIRLDEQRNAAWQTAQSVIADAINGLRHTNCPLTLTRSGAWTLLGLSGLPGTNALLAAFNTQTAAGGTPFPASTTNYWLEVNADLQELLGSMGGRGSSQAPSSETTNSTPKTWLAKTFALPKDFGLPTISLAMIGDG